jgi:hypothetical protein
MPQLPRGGSPDPSREAAVPHPEDRGGAHRAAFSFRTFTRSSESQ